MGITLKDLVNALTLVYIFSFFPKPSTTDKERTLRHHASDNYIREVRVPIQGQGIDLYETDAHTLSDNSSSPLFHLFLSCSRVLGIPPLQRCKRH